MGNFLYGGKRPTSITYQGKDVQTLKYNGVVVWTRADVYSITGTVYGNDFGGQCKDCWDMSHDCQCESYNDYQYKIKLTFSGVTRFPIKYVSKSGATVSLEKTAVTGSRNTYTYESKYIDDGGNAQDESFNSTTAINTVKSLYPASGVNGYSTISSININTKDEAYSNCGGGTTDCDCQCNCDSDGQCDCSED